MMRVLARFRLKWFKRRPKPAAAPPAASEPVTGARTGPRAAPSSRKPVSAEPRPAPSARTRVASPASRTPARRTEPVKDAEWAREQGVKDRAAGSACWTYIAFLTRYRLPKTPASAQLWAAYRPVGVQPASTPRRRLSPDRSESRARKVTASPGPPLSKQREKELRNLGAKAVVQPSNVVAFRVTGRVVDQVRVPGGHGTAARYAATFNAAVSQRHVNPTDTLPDTWR